MTTVADGAAARYLEKAKIDELLRQYSEQGYSVAREVRRGDVSFDLLATKNGRVIAIEVKARPADPATIADIARRRAKAFEQGVDEFRLVVVNPPHETRVDVAGLTDQLLEFLGENRTAELDDLPGATRVEDVKHIDIDAVEITTDGIHLSGSGTVAVEIEHDGGKERDGGIWEMDFPFTFDVVLNHDLHIEEQPNSVSVDTSGFYE